MQLVHYLEQLLRILGEHALGKLQFDVFIRDIVLVHDLAQAPDIVVVIQVQPRLIYGNHHRLLSIVYPSAHCAADFLQNEEIQLDNESVLFGYRNEIPGGDEAEFLAVPADKRLGALDVARTQPVLRLEVALEFVPLQCSRHDVFVVLLAQRTVADRPVIERYRRIVRAL